MPPSPMPPIKAILFDKDGTLLDYYRSWTPTNFEAATLAADGDPALRDRLLIAGGTDLSSGRVAPGSPLAAGTTPEIVDSWIGAGSLIARDRLVGEVDRIFRAGIGHAVAVTDLAALFARLRARGLLLGIASSDSAAAVAAMTERFDLAGAIDFAAGYDSGHGVKPDPGMLTAFAARCRITPEQIAVVGDNLHDLEMAARGGAGLKIAVLTGTGSRGDLAPHADLCLDSIADLEAALFGATRA